LYLLPSFLFFFCFVLFFHSEERAINFQLSIIIHYFVFYKEQYGKNQS
jgi:hypothetical protein